MSQETTGAFFECLLLTFKRGALSMNHNKVTARLADLKYQACLVWVLERNEQAIKFYLRQGFRFSGNIKSEDFHGNICREYCYTLKI